MVDVDELGQRQFSFRALRKPDTEMHVVVDHCL
jgi:hypothetical protein